MTDFPSLYTSSKSTTPSQINIQTQATTQFKDPKFEGNMVVVVNKKSNKRRRKKHKKKPKILTSLSPIKPTTISKKPNGFAQNSSDSNKHKRWDQYYESLFFISHVSSRMMGNLRAMKILN